MKYNEPGIYHLHYTAVDECGNETTETRTIEVKPIMTVLYEDGTLIINELSSNRGANIQAHGNVVAEYDPAPYAFDVQADIPWYSQKRSVLAVEFGSPVNMHSCKRLFNELERVEKIDLTNLTTTGCTTFARMFSGCTAMKELIGLENLDTSEATTMEMMFYNCNAIPALDCSNFDTAKVTHMGQMFRNNLLLTTIYVSDSFVTTNVPEGASGNMFAGDIRLVGGNGTTFDSSKVNKTYARIDTASTPGYFTAK